LTFFKKKGKKRKIQDIHSYQISLPAFFKDKRDFLKSKKLIKDLINET